MCVCVWQMRVEAQSVNPYSSVSVSVSPSSPLPPSASLVQLPAVSKQTMPSAAALLVWQPSMELGGWSQTICFDGLISAVEGQPRLMSSSCVLLRVARCQWAVGDGDTLDSIAHTFGSNYLQVNGGSVIDQHALSFLYDPPNNFEGKRSGS